MPLSNRIEQRSIENEIYSLSCRREGLLDAKSIVESAESLDDAFEAIMAKIASTNKLIKVYDTKHAELEK